MRGGPPGGVPGAAELGVLSPRIPSPARPLQHSPTKKFSGHSQLNSEVLLAGRDGGGMRMRPPINYHGPIIVWPLKVNGMLQ